MIVGHQFWRLCKLILVAVSVSLAIAAATTAWIARSIVDSNQLDGARNSSYLGTVGLSVDEKQLTGMSLDDIRLVADLLQVDDYAFFAPAVRNASILEVELPTASFEIASETYAEVLGLDVEYWSTPQGGHVLLSEALTQTIRTAGAFGETVRLNIDGIDKPLPVVGTVKYSFNGALRQDAAFWVIGESGLLPISLPIPSLTDSEKRSLRNVSPSYFMLLPFGPDKEFLTRTRQMLSDVPVRSREVSLQGFKMRLPVPQGASLWIVDGVETNPAVRADVSRKINTFLMISALMVIVALYTLVEFFSNLANNNANEVSVHAVHGATPLDLSKLLVEKHLGFVLILLLGVVVTSLGLSQSFFGEYPFSRYIDFRNSRVISTLAFVASLSALGIAASTATFVVFRVYRSAVARFNSLVTYGTEGATQPSVIRVILFVVISLSLVLSGALARAYFEADSGIGMENERTTVVNLSGISQTDPSPNQIRALRAGISDVIQNQEFTFGTAFPLYGDDSPDGFVEVNNVRDEELATKVVTVLPNYFSVLGLEIVEGRTFSDVGINELVVSRTLWEKLSGPSVFAEKKITYFRGDKRFQGNVVGVVQDVPFSSFNAEAQPVIYENMNLATSRQSISYMALKDASDTFLDSKLASRIESIAKIQSTYSPSQRYREQFTLQYSLPILLANLALVSAILSVMAIALSQFQSISKQLTTIRLKTLVGATRSSLAFEYIKVVLLEASLGGISSLILWYLASPVFPFLSDLFVGVTLIVTSAALVTILAVGLYSLVFWSATNDIRLGDLQQVS